MSLSNFLVILLGLPLGSFALSPAATTAAALGVAGLRLPGQTLSTVLLVSNLNEEVSMHVFSFLDLYVVWVSFTRSYSMCFKNEYFS